MIAPEGWISTEATVTTCRYQFAGLGNLAFGFSTRKKFRITFDYYAPRPPLLRHLPIRSSHPAK